MGNRPPFSGNTRLGNWIADRAASWLSRRGWKVERPKAPSASAEYIAALKRIDASPVVIAAAEGRIDDMRRLWKDERRRRRW